MMCLKQSHCQHFFLVRQRLAKGVSLTPFRLGLFTFTLIAFLACNAFGQNANLTLTVESNPAPLYPGDPCLFKVTSNTPLKSLAGKWMGKTIYFNQNKTKTFWYGIGGVSLKTVAGSQQPLSLSAITLQGKPFTETKEIVIGGTRAGGDNVIPIYPPGIDPANEEDLARIEEDRRLKRETFSLITLTPGWNGMFLPPMSSPTGSPFGKKRTYAGGKVKVHEGLDYPAPIGTPIKAINSGKVILTRPMIFEGNLVVIDHGQGLLSLYFHLSEFKVNTGEVVSQGQVIGLCGKSGRVTGAHLHLAIRWQGIYVNPAQLYKLDLTHLSSIAPPLSETKPPIATRPADAPPMPTKSTLVFSASASSVRKGGCLELTWTAPQMATIKLDGRRVKNNGRKQVCPLTNTTYNLTARRKRGIEEHSQVGISVITKQAIYSLIENASQAKWKAGQRGEKKTQEVPFGGLKEKERGLVKISNAVKLEDKKVTNNLLEISPKLLPGGILLGVYKVRFKLQKGDSFFTQIGLAANARGGNYKLQLWFRDKLLSEMAKIYTGKLVEWNVELTEFAGKEGELELRVIRNSPEASLSSVYLLTPQIER